MLNAAAAFPDCQNQVLRYTEGLRLGSTLDVSPFHAGRSHQFDSCSSDDEYARSKMRKVSITRFNGRVIAGSASGLLMLLPTWDMFFSNFRNEIKSHNTFVISIIPGKIIISAMFVGSAYCIGYGFWCLCSKLTIKTLTEHWRLLIASTLCVGALVWAGVRFIPPPALRPERIKFDDGTVICDQNRPQHCHWEGTDIPY